MALIVEDVALRQFGPDQQRFSPDVFPDVGLQLAGMELNIFPGATSTRCGFVVRKTQSALARRILSTLPDSG